MNPHGLKDRPSQAIIQMTSRDQIFRYLPRQDVSLPSQALHHDKRMSTKGKQHIQLNGMSWLGLINCKTATMDDEKRYDVEGMSNEIM